MVGAWGTGATTAVSSPLMVKVKVVRLWALTAAAMARRVAVERMVRWCEGVFVLANGMKAQEKNESAQE